MGRLAVLGRLVSETRAQHGREHATVAALLASGNRPPLGGNAAPGGFIIYGRVSAEEVRVAAEEALFRLQAGERHLAISPYCGTNLLVAAGIAALVSTALNGRSPSPTRRSTSLVIGVAAGMLLGRRAGAIVQRHVTTLPDADGVEVRDVKSVSFGRFHAHWVRIGPALDV